MHRPGTAAPDRCPVRERSAQGPPIPYPSEEPARTGHVMFDGTAVARKDRRRTVFGDR
jgi:hypothetical protein